MHALQSERLKRATMMEEEEDWEEKERWPGKAHGKA